MSESLLEHKMNIPAVVLVGILIAIGGAWQFHLIMEVDDWSDGPPRRVIFPLLFSSVLMLGVIGYEFLEVIDSGASLWSMPPPIRSGKCLAMGVLLCAKAYLGPAYAAAILSYEAFQWLVHGHFDSVPVISSILSWVFEAAGRGMADIYVVVTVLLSLGGSLWDSFEGPL